MPETPPDPRGVIRKAVGRDRQRTVLDRVWRLRRHAQSLGLLPPNPDAHVRKRVGRARP